MNQEMPIWRRTIPESRDKAQSKMLTWVVGVLLMFGAFAPLIAAAKLSLPLWPLGRPFLFSAAFAALVLALRAATPAASAIGFLICFILAQAPAEWSRYTPGAVARPLWPALLVVFILTFAATRYGRARKESRGLSESRRGRRASQIVANLGVAGLFAAAGHYEGCIVALAEAAADTVSSEIGQATGHPARLLTTGKVVAPGTNGGVTLAGTLAGLAAAAIVVGIGTMHLLSWRPLGTMWIAAAAGLFFDSLLGATLERRGLLGNDLVNFASTLFAASIASVLR
ncbi:DUF92 domain-containing protein [Edaphobacter modestus]|uniref:Uncharacterized protein (TIGR00297 family) n=1 Tax=Edaphobacter modestus TaxID=388466 RepID=A0A4Q7YRM3_9BACT|nr:DUF92 domain-containing protein [Edaphobacter modestus]RZU39824.1 uncharacterized protein (TIGR00297 family) [Edaphobacter modestus]